MINIFFTLLMLLAVLATACSKQDDAGVRATITPGNNSTLQLAATTPSATAVAVEDVPMITIPAGEFIMGSAREDVIRWNNAWNENADKYQQGFPGIFRNEMPQLRIYLDTFEIDQVEVTNEQYRACVETGACTEPGYSESIRYDDPNRANYSVVFVAHEQAETYCEWVGKRLPTEAEWEKAARGTDGRIYPWGNEWNPANLNMEWSNRPVGSAPESASPYGVLDMIGGVSEWVAEDELVPYSSENQAALITEQRGRWVVRGGGKTSAFVAELQLRIAVREVSGNRSDDLGFRCARGTDVPQLSDSIVELLVPTPIPTPSQVDLTNMVLVDAGEFVMGVDDPEDVSLMSASPAHPVYLDTFYIDQYEVTWTQFAQFVNELGGIRIACSGYDCTYEVDNRVGSYSYITEVDGQFYPLDGGEQFPALVIWFGAQSYCQSLGKRLPTEAEWEKVARGPDDLKYPWGNDWLWPDDRDDIADSIDRAEVGTHPRDVSGYGVFDMLGNASEWTSDWYDPDYYIQSPYRNPTGPPESVDRYNKKATRVAVPFFGLYRRMGHGTDAPIGFRCVYTP